MGFSVYGLIALNVISFILFGADKRKAKKDLYRISEKSLWISAVLFGAFGAFAGMKIFHHKTKKKKFLIFVPLMLIAQAALLVWYFFFSNIRISILY